MDINQSVKNIKQVIDQAVKAGVFVNIETAYQVYISFECILKELATIQQNKKSKPEDGSN